MTMPSVQNTGVCLRCGKEIMYDFDCRSGEYTQLTCCDCDKREKKLKAEVRRLRRELKKAKG